jgi:hypothetical protein
MEPFIGRTAFNIGVFLILLSIFVMPFLKRGSVEYIINIIALGISITFLCVVIYIVRREVKKNKP